MESETHPLSMEVLKVKCGTCPFRENSPYADLAPLLACSALNASTRVCHSTGKGNAINEGDTGRPEAICRGARDLQLAWFAGIGFLSAPTDEAWAEKCKELGITPDAVRKT